MKSINHHDGVYVSSRRSQPFSSENDDLKAKTDRKREPFGPEPFD
jgi:hypothetical protein